MRKMSGLVGQHMARPLTRPVSPAAFPLGGMNLHKRFSADFEPKNLNGSNDSSSVTTPWLTITPASKRRGAIHEVDWRQLAGPPGDIVRDGPLRNYFRHTISGYATYPISWRAIVYNQFGDATALDVTFNLTRYEPPPPLQAVASPSEQTLVTINPQTRQATVYFSVSVTSGVPPYSYDWNGGDDPYSPTNSATFTIPVGQTVGIDFIAGCWVTDSLGRTILVQTGQFFIYEGPGG